MKQEEGQSIHSIEQAVVSDEMTRVLEDTRRNHAINYVEDKRNNRFGPLTDPSEDPRRKSWRKESVLAVGGISRNSPIRSKMAFKSHLPINSPFFLRSRAINIRT